MTGSLAEFVSSLPEFKDANRRRALFGALPLRSVNEGAYLDRISFWKGTLSSVLQQGLLGERTVLTITPDFAQNFRTSEGIAPRSLAGVLNQMVGDGSLVDFQTFFSKGGPGSAPGGVLGLPLKWLWSFVTRTNEGESTDSVDELPVGRFVLIDSVNHASKLVLDAHIKSGLGASSSVLTLYEFRRLLGSALGLERNENIADHDVSTILLKLTRNRQIVTEGIHIGPDGVWSTVGQGIIKFRNRDSADSLDSISELDRSILRIRTTLSTLQGQEQSLAQRLESLEREVKERIASRQKPRALALLKQKKVLEQMLAKCTNSSLLLESTLGKIEQAKQDSEVLAAIEAGSKALKTLTGPEQVENARRVMEEWEDVLADQEELNSVLESPGGPIAADETEELEQELANITNQNVSQAEDLDAELEKLASLTLMDKEPQSAHSPRPTIAEALDRLPQVPSSPVRDPSADESSKVGTTQERIESEPIHV